MPSLKFFAFAEILCVCGNLRLGSNSSPSYVANSECEKNNVHPAHAYLSTNQSAFEWYLHYCTIYLMIRSTYGPIESILLPFQWRRTYRLFWVSAIVYALIDRYGERSYHLRVFWPSNLKKKLQKLCSSSDVLNLRKPVMLALANHCSMVKFCGCIVYYLCQLSWCI